MSEVRGFNQRVQKDTGKPRDDTRLTRARVTLLSAGGVRSHLIYLEGHAESIHAGKICKNI